MRISDWSSDVCSSDLDRRRDADAQQQPPDPAMARARVLHGGDGWRQPLRLRRQVAPAGEVDDQPEDHAHARRAETVVTAVELAERAAPPRREQAADDKAAARDVVGADAAGIDGGGEGVDRGGTG